MNTVSKVRIGIMGVAGIVTPALVQAATRVPEVQLEAVASRTRSRAETFATRHGIGRAHASYEALLDDPGVEAIYVPLPISLHAEWTLRAFERGKHVLCEKPLAANANEAEQMAKAAERHDRVLMEAFHYRYHPLAARLRAIVAGGELGRLTRIDVEFCVPLLRRSHIAYRYDLAGGATMDVGCYTVNLARFLVGAEPTVVAARAKLASPQVDRCMEADLDFPNGLRGRIFCSLLSWVLVRARARIVGELGELRVFNPFQPHKLHRVTVRTRSGTRREQVPGESTYVHQLRAFAAAVRTGARFETTAADAVKNMRVIESIYRRAGLQPRGTPASG